MATLQDGYTGVVIYEVGDDNTGTRLLMIYNIAFVEQYADL